MSRHLAASPASEGTEAALSGRAALTDGTCPIHGPGPDGEPCARFAHLRPDGRGAFRVGLLRRLSVIPRRLIKPVVLIGFVGGTAWAAVHVFPTLVSGLPGVGK